MTLHGIAQCNVVSLVIILYKVLPQSLLCHLACTLAYFLDFGFRLGREQGYGVLDAVCHFGIVIVRTVQHFHSVVYAMLVFRLFTQSPKPARSVVMVGTRKATLSSGVYPHGS